MASSLKMDDPGQITAVPVFRVTIPLGSFHLSGGVKVLVLLANGMAQRGWQVTFLAPDYAPDSPFPLETDIRIRVLKTGPGWMPPTIRKLFYYARLSLESTRQADLCLANYYLTLYPAVVSRLLIHRQAQILCYLQGYEAGSHGLLAQANWASRIIRYLLAKLSYCFPIRIFCVSQWVKNQIARPDAQVLNPPALNLAVFTPMGRRESNGTLTIGTIGRQGATKGYSDFLRALDHLPASLQVQIRVASPKPHEVALPTRFPSEGLCIQSESGMADFYRSCDLFVLTSRMEGFPLPPLEAMACGGAVVATACGGISEYGQAGINCLIVPLDDPAVLAQAILQLCQNPAAREKLAQEGIRTASRYGQACLTTQFLDAVSAHFPQLVI